MGAGMSRGEEAAITTYIKFLQVLFLGSACATAAIDYSTVTDLARLRGWSTSVPLSTAT